jgi:protein-disulfide isomerase
VQPELFRDYVDTGQVVWSFRHFPLTAIHSQARAASELAECAAAQAGFWPAHDLLFTRWQGTPLTSLDVSDLSVDMTSLNSCTQHSQPAVDRDLRDGAALGVSSTPTFFVGALHNGQVSVHDVIIGRVPTQRYRTAIDKVLMNIDSHGSPITH